MKIIASNPKRPPDNRASKDTCDAAPVNDAFAAVADAAVALTFSGVGLMVILADLDDDIALDVDSEVIALLVVRTARAVVEVLEEDLLVVIKIAGVVRVVTVRVVVLTFAVVREVVLAVIIGVV